MLYINITFVIRFVKIKKNPPSSHTHTHKPTYLCFITCLLIFQIKRLNGYYTLYVKLEHLIGGPPHPTFLRLKEVWISRMLKYLISLLSYTDELCCPNFYFLYKQYTSFYKCAFLWCCCTGEPPGDFVYHTEGVQQH